MPDLRGLMADPQFKALPLERQHAILARVNPQLADEYVATRRQPRDTPSVGGMLMDAASNVPEGSAVGRFASGLWKNINPATMVEGLATAVAHPIKTAQAAVGQMGEQWEKAGTAGIEGRWSEAIGHGLAGSLPLVGPAAAAAGERIGSGDVAGGLGEAAGLVMPMAAARPVARGAGHVAGPFKGKVNPEVVAAAKRQGVEMPAAALSDSKLVSLAEAVSAKGIGGSRTAGRYTEANRLLTEMADHTVKRASALPDASAAGQAIANGLDLFRSQWTKQKNALYKQAALPEKGLKVEARATVELLDAIIDGKKDAAGILKAGPVADATFYRGLRDGLTRTVTEGKWVGEEFVKTTRRVLKPVEADKLLKAMRELRSKVSASFADPFAAANKGTLKKLAATIDGEFQTALQTQSPALAKKLAAANEAYRIGLQKINSTFGKKIHTLAQDGRFDKIASSIANPKVSVDDIPKIMEVAGAQGTEGIRMAVLADVVNRAKNAQGQLTPQGLGGAIKAYGDDRLGALLLPDQMAKLKDLSTLTASMEKGSKIMSGSQTAFLSRYQAAAGAFFVDPINTMLYLLLDRGANQFFASPAGQRWLTTGWNVPKAKIAAGVSVAAQAGRVPTETAGSQSQ